MGMMFIASDSAPLYSTTATNSCCQVNTALKERTWVNNNNNIIGNPPNKEGLRLLF